MFKKRFLSLFLAVALLCGMTPALAAGTQEDPLVSLSYAKTWAESILKNGAASITSYLTPFYETAKKNALAALSSGVGSTSCTINAGGTVSLATGSSIMLLSGSASAKVNAGEIVNLSLGAAAGNGALSRYNRYIACEDSSLTVTADATSVFLIDGEFTKNDTAGVFTDVPYYEWYYTDVYAAVGNGLISGMTATTYGPNQNLSLAQAITLAARMHQLNSTGAVTLANSEPWYKSYVDYAVANGIVDSSYASLTEAEYNSAVTRREYVSIFYKALPASEYTQINSIPDNAIPDVKSTESYAAEVYALYRAGILTGSGSSGTVHWFLPDTNIARSEVAAVLTRMFDADARKTFTIS